MKKPIAKINNEKLYIDIGNYSVDKSLYLALVTNDGELYDDLTICLKDVPHIAKDYIYINKDISDGLIDYLKDKKVISDTLMYQRYNMGSYELVKVDLDELRKYDNDGVEKFLDMYEKSHYSNKIEEQER